MEEQLVVFQLADEMYAMSIQAVEGIIKMQSITRVPHAPPYVEGVTNLRGEVLPVMDLRKRFGLDAHTADEETRIIVVEMGEEKVGMIVDGVSEVLRIPAQDIEPPSSLVGAVDAVFLKGIAKLEGDRLVVLVDLERILTLEEKAELEGFEA